MTTEQRQNRIIIGFILLSLLLHLLLLLIPKHTLFPADSIPEPVYVEVRPAQPLDRELDLPIREELEKPRETPARQLAERDQVVEQEMAPEGQDSEDRQQSVPVPEVVSPPRPQPRPTPPTPQPRPTPPAPPAQQAAESPPAPVTPDGWQVTEEQKPLKELPDLATLTQISPGALARIESDWRRKFRDDVAKGDTIWMDTQQDLLFSFMKRFRDNIYGVWNYPTAAIERQQQGTCLLRITVDREGNVTDVVLLESSSYLALDEEAMRAVRKGASYGPLPRAYPHPDLKIMAFFQYHMSGVVQRTRRLPGYIY